MATDRKAYCRIETSLLREPWPDDLKLALVRLIMFMCDRWARDRLTTAEAVRVVLSKAQVAEITGKHRADVGAKLLRSLAEVTSMLVESRGNFTSIEWPKLAESQGWSSRDREISPRKLPESAPAPAPAPATPLTGGGSSPSAPTPPARPRALKANGRPRKTRCPEHLTPEQWADLIRWRDEHHPEFDDAQLRSTWELHRDHHLSRGTLAIDWVRSLRTWLLKDGPRAGGPRPSGFETTEQRVDREFDAWQAELAAKRQAQAKGGN